MEKYGKVNLINMPKKEDGKYKGYAFVVFEDKKEASKAIDSINSSDKKIMGTKMAADWCLPKNIFLRSNKNYNISEVKHRSYLTYFYRPERT